eukprot:1047577_1
MNDFDMNLHLRAASKPELDDKYHANVINQFDRTIGRKKDKTKFKTTATTMINVTRLRTKITMQMCIIWMKRNMMSHNQRWIASIRITMIIQSNAITLRSNPQSMRMHMTVMVMRKWVWMRRRCMRMRNTNLIQTANAYSASNALNYNKADGIYDDAGNFYDRNAMCELLNFYFVDGLNLNNEDDWDEMTITTKAKRDSSKSNAMQSDGNYYDDAEGGFRGKDDYYKRQAALSEDEQVGIQDTHSIRQMVRHLNAAGTARIVKIVKAFFVSG